VDEVRVEVQVGGEEEAEEEAEAAPAEREGGADVRGAQDRRDRPNCGKTPAQAVRSDHDELIAGEPTPAEELDDERLALVEAQVRIEAVQRGQGEHVEQAHRKHGREHEQYERGRPGAVHVGRVRHK
jgi:hypothetical protein